MKAKIFGIDGNVVGGIEVPSFISEAEVREEIIRRAVLSEESYLYQPKGNYRWAGLETSADYVGRKEVYRSLKNRGRARLPREFFGGGIPGRVRRIPSAVGGRRAHPPKPWKKLIERINKKEWRKALISAIKAAFDSEYVVKRGHKVDASVIPACLDDKVEELTKTKDAYNLLNRIIPEDLERAKNGKKRRTGVRRRKGGYIYPKSALIVLTKPNKAFENIAGVDVRSVDELKVRDLAPGAHPGRLTFFSASALKKLEDIVKGWENE